MAEDKLLKTVRISYDIKVEVYQQGKKRKYALFYDNQDAHIRRYKIGDNTKSEKYDIAMSDDDVIEMALKAYNSKYGTPDIKYYITQKVYSDPIPARTYGNGESSPYYLNNGCAINIKWIGQIPNPDFVLGTFSSITEAEKETGIKSYLRDVLITSTVDDATDESKLPSTSWGGSSVSHKEVTVTLPKGFTENGGKGYLVWTRNGLKYSDSKDVYPSGTDLTTDLVANGAIVTKVGDVISNFPDHTKDSTIVGQVISNFEDNISRLHGIYVDDVGIKLCTPDNEACSLIPYKSPLEPPVKANDVQTPVGTTQSAPTKIKFTIDGLPTEIIVKAKEDLDTFTIWTGPIPKVNNGSGNVDDYEPLGEEYIETDAIITDEQQIKLDLQVYLTQGDSEGTEDVPGTTTTTGGGVNTNGTNAGGSGVRRFQQQLTIRGRVVKNGEIPSDLLAKVDFGGYLLEKHAAVKFSALNKAFKEKFGKNFTISGPYRPFNVGNSIFDWDYFNKTGKGRKIGTNGGTAAAKPGTSKHGWGQAMDIGGFGNGPGNVYFDWMEQNAKKYGWINPAWAKKPGAGYEPWHWEYIGDDLFAA